MNAKIFTSGNSQAVRLPKEYRVSEKELLIKKIGRAIILMPKKNPWNLFNQSLAKFSKDCFSAGRQQPKIQKRRGL